MTCLVRDPIRMKVYSAEGDVKTRDPHGMAFRS
jgi:hypothetical protein